MRTRLNLVVLVLAAGYVLAGAGKANADIIITVGPSPAGDLETLLFGLEPGPALIVQGETNISGYVFNIEGTEPLITPAMGQARVEAEDGGFTFAWIYPDDPTLLFQEFVANLQFFATTTGFATVTAFDQFGGSEFLTFGVGPGENFFNVTAIASQLLRGVQVETTVEMTDIRQIRVGGFQILEVPEPSVLLVLGLGLVACASRLRRMGGRYR
jgi:hypothetical protein